MPKSDYEIARYIIRGHLGVHIQHAATVLEDHWKKTSNRPPMLGELIKALDWRLQKNFTSAGIRYAHNLAVIDSRIQLFTRTANTLIKEVPELALPTKAVDFLCRRALTRHLVVDGNVDQNFFDQANQELEKSEVPNPIDHTKAALARAKNEITDFKNGFSIEIAAEKATPGYKQGLQIIRQSLLDLTIACQGFWKPEFITIEDYPEPGGKMQHETPDSAKLTAISDAVKSGRRPRLPIPGIFTLD